MRDEFRAIIDEGLGNSSYLVEVAQRRAIVVDPSRDPLPRGSEDLPTPGRFRGAGSPPGNC
jgi:hypothetical protein